jgi:hypothetical protein
MRMLLAPGQFIFASLLLLLWRLGRSFVILVWLLLYNGCTQLDRGIRWVWHRTAHARAARDEPDRTIVPFRRRR